MFLVLGFGHLLALGNKLAFVFLPFKNPKMASMEYLVAREACITSFIIRVLSWRKETLEVCREVLPVKDLWGVVMRYCSNMNTCFMIDEGATLGLIWFPTTTTFLSTLYKKRVKYLCVVNACFQQLICSRTILVRSWNIVKEDPYKGYSFYWGMYGTCGGDFFLDPYGRPDVAERLLREFPPEMYYCL